MNSEKASSKKTLSQKEYLKRYLSKSKPKKRPIKRANVKVIDDNDLTGFHTEENNDLEVGEDAPVIAAIIDERPKTIQRLEEYKTSNRWAPVPAVDEVSNKSSDKQNRGDRVEQDNIHGDDESRHNSPTTESKFSRGNDPSFKKHRPSKPETIQASSHKKSEYSKNRSHEHSSSPPLPKESCLKNSRDLNTKNHKRYGTPSPEKKSSYKKRRYSSDENSPPRKIKYSKESEKSRREKRCEESFSPDRCELKSRKKDQEMSKTKKKRSSLSPDHEMSEKKRKKRDKFSPEHFSNDSRDRKRKMDEKVRGSSSSKKKRDMDSSERSPPSHESRRIKKNRASSVDSSPMHYDKVKKKKKKDRRSSPKRTIKKRSSSSSSYSSDQNNDRKSKRSFNKKEKYGENNSGVAAVSEKSRDYDKKGKVKERHSSPVNEKTEKYSPSRYSSRSKNGMENEDKTINSKRNSRNESERHDRKADVESNENKKKPTAEEYYQWGKGLKQIEDENEKLAYDLREMSKPLARYKDDEDLDKHLKYMERDGDPLLIIKRNADEDDNSKPRYKGTFPQNRFGIAPGHKWDGVDRSNGYEVKWLGKAKAKEAVEEEAYKWSTADM